MGKKRANYFYRVSSIIGLLALTNGIELSPATAQADSLDSQSRYLCEIRIVESMVERDRAPLKKIVYNVYFALVSSEEEVTDFKNAFEKFRLENFDNYLNCQSNKTLYFDEYVENFKVGNTFENPNPYQYHIYKVRSADELVSDWRKSGPADTKTLSLRFKPAFQRPGYKSAFIDLRYRFILCAGEVQVAYSLDRNSLKSTDAYLVGEKGNLTPVIDPAMPEAPLTVDLNAVVWLGGTLYRSVLEFRDAIAGESLGMGCFDGQTRKVGTVKELFGSNVTPAQVKEYLAEMTLSASTLPNVLTNPDLRSPTAERIAELERQRIAEEAAVEAARLAVEAMQLEESKKRIAAMRAEWDKTMAEHNAEVAKAAAAKAEYEAKIRQNAQERAAFEAAAAKHKAEMEAYRRQYPNGQ
jgi:hypothetical protein